MDDLNGDLICEYLNYLKIESVNDLLKYNHYWKQTFSKIKYKYEKKFINSEKYNSELIYLNKVKKTIKDNYSLFDKYLKNIKFEENKDTQTSYSITQDTINNSRNSKENENFNSNNSKYNPKITYNYSEESSKYNGSKQPENQKDVKKSSKSNSTSYTGLAAACYGLVRLWQYLEPGWRILFIVSICVYLIVVLDLGES